MTAIRDIPIGTKLNFAILLACSTVLIVACAVLFVFQSNTIKAQFVKDLVAVGEIVSENSAAAAAFNDEEAAAKTLQSLKGKEAMEYACLILSDGKHVTQIFAGEPHTTHDPATTSDGLHFHGSYIVNVVPVENDGKRDGTLILGSNFATVHTPLLKLYLGMVVLVLVASMLIAALLSRRFQQLITDPIAKLASTVKTVAENRDYSARATKLGNDEVGSLTDAFNHLLEQVQANDELRHEIAERKRSEAALRESEQRFRSVAESATDAIIIADENLQVLSCNPAAETIFGFSEHEVIELRLPELFAAGARKEDILAAATGKTVVMTAQRRDGTRFPMELSLATWKTDAGTFFSGIVRDISERVNAENALRASQQRLLETSRLAGMAEVATGVLHNVGNVLNSVNISAGLAANTVRNSAGHHLAAVAEMLRKASPNLGEFFTNDERGKRLPGFIDKVSGALAQEREKLMTELELLNKNVTHIKDIVAMQQSYARVAGVTEPLQLSSLVEDAIELNAAALKRHGIDIVREFQPVPDVQVEKQKVLQVLVNLVRNAKHAMQAHENGTHALKVGVNLANDGFVEIRVTDSGCGIAPENLTRVFSHGFTTKREGHGFGLHSSANAAKEMGGTLTGTSHGLGHGATFTLRLPARGVELPASESEAVLA